MQREDWEFILKIQDKHMRSDGRCIPAVYRSSSNSSIPDEIIFIGIMFYLGVVLYVMYGFIFG